jgi:hypothetical protein
MGDRWGLFRVGAEGTDLFLGVEWWSWGIEVLVWGEKMLVWEQCQEVVGDGRVIENCPDGGGGIGVQRGVSKGVEDGRRPPTLQTGHTSNGRKAVSGVARPQHIEGLGMAGPGET